MTDTSHDSRLQKKEPDRGGEEEEKKKVEAETARKITRQEVSNK